MWNPLVAETSIKWTGDLCEFTAVSSHMTYHMTAFSSFIKVITGKYTSLKEHFNAMFTRMLPEIQLGILTYLWLCLSCSADQMQSFERSTGSVRAASPVLLHRAHERPVWPSCCWDGAAQLHSLSTSEKWTAWKTQRCGGFGDATALLLKIRQQRTSCKTSHKDHLFLSTCYWQQSFLPYIS